MPYNPQYPNQQESVTVNVQPLDFSLPQADFGPDNNVQPMQNVSGNQNMQGGMQPPAYNNMPYNPQYSNQNSGQGMNQNQFGMNQAQFNNAQTPQLQNDMVEIEEDINQLFLSDTSWQEPDWTTFDPYKEPQIEEPTSQDFGISLPKEPAMQEELEVKTRPIPSRVESDLPEFVDTEDRDGFIDLSISNQQPHTESVAPPREMVERQQMRRPANNAPIDLFVKGSDYKSVLEELNVINDLLNTPEPGIDMTEDLIRKQEADLLTAKENMEFIYKKLMAVDKKIFTE